MPQALKYIVAKNGDLAGSVTVKDGKILVNIKNYTRVHSEPVVPEDTAQSCYAILVNSDKLHSCPDKPGEITEKIWDGPHQGQQLPQRLIPCELYSLKSPLGGLDAEILADLERAQKALAAAQEEISDQEHQLNEVHGKVAKLEDKAANAKAEKDALAKQVSALQAELVEVRSSTVIQNMSVELLAEAINHCEDGVLIELPFIGGDTIKHLKRWAQDVAAKAENEDG